MHIETAAQWAAEANRRPVHNTTWTRRRRTAVAILLAVSVLGACGDDDSGDSATSTTTADSTGPTDSTSAETTTTVAEDPLGPIDVAEGEPVKIGFVYDGRNPNLDVEYQLEFTKGVTKFLNEHKGGVGGRPIELLSCVSGQANPSKAAECANEMVRANVVLTIMADSTAVQAVHEVLSVAKVPLFIFSISNRSVLTDSEAMFSLYDPTAGVAQLPIAVAKANNLKKVTAVVIDVPAATELYSTPEGQAPFEEAGIELEMIRGPIGQVDFTPQMSQVASGDPTVVHIVGNDAFCISVLRGLQAANYDGPLSTVFVCVNDTVREAMGGYIEGMYVSVGQPLGDTEDPGWIQAQAIIDKYGGDVPDLPKAMNTYAVWMAAWQAISDITGEITPATVTAKIKSMPNMEIPGGGGLVYRCNGKALDGLPAVCMQGALRTQLDETGNPSLPYEPVGNGPVAD
jgi:branched-chain amino acid transport system substrate-binding protein